MRCVHLCGGHVLGHGGLRGGRVVPLEHVQHRLRVALLLLFADVGGHQQPRPRFRHPLRQYYLCVIKLQ